MRFAVCASVAICVLSSLGSAQGRLGDVLVSNDAPDALDAGCREVTSRPIIGVMTQGGHENGLEEYVAGDYIKYLEMAGARVVAIRYQAAQNDLEGLRKQFDSINGLLFPGGGADLSPGHPFFDTADQLFQWALEANRNGDYFPIWGTCLGFELLNVLASGNNATVLTGSGLFDAEDYPTPVTFTEKAASSELLGKMPRYLVDAIQKENITQNAHSQGISPNVFYGNPNLSGFFNNLANYVDRKGRPFVAVVEAKHGLPIYATQFHPEKPLFSWRIPTNIPHSENSIALGQYTANFFVKKTRCSSHKFKGGFEEESQSLIQVKTKRVVVPGGYFSEVYGF
mmetsp:Transcript_16637/g.30514  ORF Transcript_16637/g.30514 Transcript_16637/m.30514 type:complete len:340 (+) Transcript_16637:2035-3054(+)